MFNKRKNNVGPQEVPHDELQSMIRTVALVLTFVISFIVLLVIVGIIRYPKPQILDESQPHPTQNLWQTK